LLLLVAMFRVGAGQLAPGLTGQLDAFLGDLGRTYLMVPVGAVLLAAVFAKERLGRSAEAGRVSPSAM